MLAVLIQHCRPDTVSNAFASLISLFNDVQGELEPILEYPLRFDGLTLKLLRCKVVLPHLLSVMLFLCALHVCYADIIEQFRTHFKSIETMTVDSIIFNVVFQDGFKLVDSKKGKRGAGASNPNQRMPAAATANTDRQGQVWQSPFEWLSKYGLKGIKGHWTRAMAGMGIFPICHRDEKPFHVPTQCPLLTELNLKLIVCQPARPSPAPAAPAGNPGVTPSTAPTPGGHVASANDCSVSGSAGSVMAPSGLTAMVAPIMDNEGEYDTDEDYVWDSDETAFGDQDCKLTKSVV
jgi:hypothetical protein